MRSWQTTLALMEPQAGPHKQPVNIHVEATSVDDMQMSAILVYVRALAVKNSVAVQRAAPSIPLLSTNPRITLWQILSSNKRPLFAGGPHTWPELALLRNARNSTVCVSQRKLAAANYAPFTGSRRCNIKYESSQLYKAKRESRCRGTRVEGSKMEGRLATFVREREIRGEVQTHTAHANRTFSMDFWTARKRNAESSLIS
ncbi:hypothetical protein ALC53_13485 [Atta colombica]|uniref:Uncharacterized protein n=1 Tax=Atta colombica TaxID=520822 RepID=A0A195AVE7_9HYME|nr:hypothetical protein ALC53_13485 [Atta colombica]